MGHIWRRICVDGQHSKKKMCSPVKFCDVNAWRPHLDMKMCWQAIDCNVNVLAGHIFIDVVSSGHIYRRHCFCEVYLKMLMCCRATLADVSV